MELQDNLFLGMGLFLYVVKVVYELLTPSIINIEFFMNFGFFPLVTFYVLHIIDVQMFYPKSNVRTTKLNNKRGKEE